MITPMITTRTSRRAFLGGAAALAGLSLARLSTAASTPFFKGNGLPIGLQLYTLGDLVEKDLPGTLKAVADMGYRAVELPGFYGHTAGDLAAALKAAGLVCESAHINAQGRGPAPSLSGDLDALVRDAHTIGLKFIVMPMFTVPARLGGLQAGEGFGDFLARVASQFTADDWKSQAAFLNEKGAALKKAGLQLAYHNHNPEFAVAGGPGAGGTATGYDILLAETDPDLVKMEMDAGWVAAAGLDPVALLQTHPGRFRLMHVKDLKAGTVPNTGLKMDPTEVGGGTLDWHRILPAAHAAGINHFYVEQEPPFARPRLEAARLSADYLGKLAV
ncbi:sugar phosphate isomerase/epimerase family protein [Nitrospirillum amazonense]|uniref:Sugar phosphate isomerase/epimerase n=2 Tax=Nitrospirillum amazonense TaxID=28077 RepID=A0A560K3D6_9PROT|nr:sugar phosphate isomerase/epimerase [Nitrospirillum amazonense]MDG3444238.1 sugar phosphate isomerase/epimerase [Nitrospirillum amazonense]TWB77792.1 sugar phosphate isomerase/epimerase [Nitrospirillum amazonense]